MATQVPSGFQLAGVHCGVKSKSGYEDLSLIVPENPAVAAGVYTQNQFCAAPVRLSRTRTPSSSIGAVVINSGNANSCTGEQGWRDAVEMTRKTAEVIGHIGEERVLVLSTGLIGEPLPMDRIKSGIAAAAHQLGNDNTSLIAAARGMMTTDTIHKLSSTQLCLEGSVVQITGLAKGAAMIGPHMATMLAIVLTDAALEPTMAQQILTAVVDESFNAISVEGHMSTNDSVLLLATGAASPQPLAEGSVLAFREAVGGVCKDLALAIVDDGEGALHRITIDVVGCSSCTTARKIAKTMANSVLVKTAVAGADPNWGRLLSAAGYAGVPFDPQQVSLSVNGFMLYKAGAPLAFDGKKLHHSMSKQRETRIVLRLAEGENKARFWTTDLTEEYVRLNADYHT